MKLSRFRDCLLEHFDLYQLDRWPARSARVQPIECEHLEGLWWFHDALDQGRGCP